MQGTTIPAKKTIRLQPKERPDMTLPYPFFIEDDGSVGRQDFWKGEPAKLIGFSKEQKAGAFSFGRKAFMENPQMAVGHFPIFADKDDNWSTYGDVIGSVSVKEKN